MPQISIGDDIKSSNGLVGAYKEVDANYTITSTSGPNGGNDYLVGVNTETASRTINLPTDSAREVGRMYYIFDSTGSASANNIIVDASSTNDAKINGADTVTISADYNSLTLVCIDSTSSPKLWIVI